MLLNRLHPIPLLTVSPPEADQTYPNPIMMTLPIVGNLHNISDFAAAFHHGSKHFFRHAPLPPGGYGLYAPAHYLTHPSLPHHTIFTPHPSCLRPDQKLPVLVWANGLGLAWGLMFGAFLREVASHGYIVIASGSPGDDHGWWHCHNGGLGRLQHADETTMVEAVRWAVDVAEKARGSAWEAGVDVRAHVDGERIALAGQSKGGTHAYAAAAMLRRDEDLHGVVKSVGLFNSGTLVRTAAHLAQVEELDVPVFYCTGGKEDLAWRAVERDWEEGLQRNLPCWWGNLPGAGHLGTFYAEGDDGGAFGRAAVDWLGWVLREDEDCRARLIGGGYEKEGWEVRSRSM